MSSNIDDLTYTLLCNRQKKHKNYFVKKENDIINPPNIDENKQIIKIIKQKINNIHIKNTKLDEITDNLLTTCIELIKYNLNNEYDLNNENNL